jgi:ClpP class serine protease
MAEVDRVADGRIMSGSQAKQAKLVDELGTLRDAVQEAANMAGLKGKPNVVYPMKSGRKWLELIMDETQRGEDSDASLSFAALVLRALFQPLSQGGADATSSTGFGSGLQPGIYWMWKGAI